MLSYDAIVTEVTARLGNRQDLSARIGRWINYAWFELLLNPRFSFFELDKGPVLATTVANTAVYDLSLFAPDIWIMLDLRDNTNSRRVRRVHYTEIDKVTTTSGQPVRYYRYSSTIGLDPVPDLPYQLQLRYRTRPPDLASGQALSPGLGTEWEEPIIVFAALKGFQALDQVAKSNEQRQLLEPMLAARMDVPTLEDADAEPTVQPTLLFPSF